MYISDITIVLIIHILVYPVLKNIDDRFPTILLKKLRLRGRIFPAEKGPKRQYDVFEV